MSYKFIKSPLALIICSVLFLTACDDSPNLGSKETPSIPNTGSGFADLVPAENEAIIHLAFTELLSQTRAAGLTAEERKSLSLHVWNNDACNAIDLEKVNEKTGYDGQWGNEKFIPEGETAEGVYWRVPINQLEASKSCINFIVREKGITSQSPDLKFDLNQFPGRKITTVFGDFNRISDTLEGLYTNSPVVSSASAHWVDKHTFIWDQKEEIQTFPVRLYYSDSKIVLNDKNEFDAPYIELTSNATLTNETAERYPHLKGFSKFGLPSTVTDEELQKILQGEIILVAVDDNGVSQGATQIQPAGALDAIFAEKALELSYGAVIEGNSLTFRLWAPTAKSVKLKLYDADKKALNTLDMTYDSASGAWSKDGLSFADLNEHFYRYEITVYHPQTREMRTYEVTDPYSLSLSMNSEYSQVVDINSNEYKPAGWDELQAPHPQSSPIDIAGMAIHEVHIRDLSIGDPYFNGSDSRGKFKALTESDSAVVQHLKSLSKAGMTHMELLPIFDIATINEDKSKVADIEQPFSELCKINASVKANANFASYCNSGDTVASVYNTLLAKDTAENPVIQELNQLVAQTDSYNWGYDPFHYTVPEGSYSTNPDGTTRIIELREMIMGIKQDIGMNVIMDVVYNHTNSAGPDSRSSVLDKIVPWYYQRLNPTTGEVETGTCCSDTASENKMFAKMIEDSLIVWTRDYKIDAFRFDLMGYHPKQQIIDALDKVRDINKEVYFLGEGWDSGRGGRFEIASQINLTGAGIGTFSDRLRDAVRGGGPFDSKDDLRKNQGVGNGAIVMPNEMNPTISDDTKKAVLNAYDLTRLGMAGNLVNYKMIDQNGQTVLGKDVSYNGAPAGYAKDPTEILNYVSKHDNQALWDMISYKAPKEADVDLRVRMQAVSLATVLLGQGVAFDQQGSELLRSKSFERDSYDSGDWYNWVDYTFNSNNFGIGLPRKDKDGDNYPVIGKAIKDGGATGAQSSQIEKMQGFYNELLMLRRSNSPLMILGTGEEINKRIDYKNVGPDQKVGLIIQTIDDGVKTTDMDPALDGVIIVINATNDDQMIDDFKDEQLMLSEKQNANLETSLAHGTSIENGIINVKPWSVSVINKAQTSERTGLPVTDK